MHEVIAIQEKYVIIGSYENPDKVALSCCISYGKFDGNIRFLGVHYAVR